MTGLLLFRHKKYANRGKLINVLVCINAAFLLPLSKYFQVSFSLLMQELLSEFRWENELIYQDSCPAKDKCLHLIVISHHLSKCGGLICHFLKDSCTVQT